MDFFSVLFSYLFSFSLVMLVFVYGLNLPRYITQNEVLVHEYYFDVYSSLNVILDFFLIIAYLLIASLFIYLFQVRSHIKQLLIVLLTTCIISSLFMLYFRLSPIYPSSFFSRWFHRVGFRAVVYDMILLALVFIVMMAFSERL